MNGRDKRRKKAERRRNDPKIKALTRKSLGLSRLCPNGCGEPGPHFVPPSFGDRGFFVCTPKT